MTAVALTLSLNALEVFYVMTWAWKSSKETAAALLRLSGGLRIERPRGVVPKGGWQRERGKMWLNWGKVFSLQLPHDSMIIDQSKKHDLSSPLEDHVRILYQRLDASFLLH